MSLRSLFLATYIGSGLFSLPIQMLPKKFSYLESSATQIQSQNCAGCNNFCTIKELKNIAKSITVQIISKNNNEINNLIISNYVQFFKSEFF